MTVKPILLSAELRLKPEVVPFFDPATNTISYIVRDPNSTACAVVDSVMDFDYASGRISFEHADAIITHIQDKGWKLEWLIETHAHADHLSAAPYIQRHLGGKLGIESYAIGTMTVQVMATPGHTPACMTHVVGDVAFVGDTLFMPDGGSARADFPGGDAATLFHSMRRILSLPDETRLFMCHDYGPNGREIRWETTVGDERKHNIHVHDGVTETEFVRLRIERDATLAMPKLIIPSLQVNIRGGELPPKDESGRTFLKVPVNAL